MSTPDKFYVKEGLYYYDKVISNTQTCERNCPEVTGATTGVSLDS